MPGRPEPGPLVEVHVGGVYTAENADGSRAIFVMVSDGERRLPIVIGPFEAQAISAYLEGEQPDRPMTHDLTKTLLEKAGATVEQVVIDDLWNGIYYAKLHVKHGKEQMEIDARPSDAIAIGIRFGAKLYIADAILASGGE